MGRARTEDRVECRTPTPNKQPSRILRWKFDAVRDAILRSVPQEDPGIAFRDLPARVEQELGGDLLAEIGQVHWYTTTVKLEMEVRGELARVPNATPQRLIRTG